MAAGCGQEGGFESTQLYQITSWRILIYSGDMEDDSFRNHRGTTKFISFPRTPSCSIAGSKQQGGKTYRLS
jgi:hypothetical protein